PFALTRGDSRARSVQVESDRAPRTLTWSRFLRRTGFNAIESDSSLIFLIEHDLVRKPVPTFRDHALARLVVDRHGVKLEPVIDQLVAEPPGHLRLQLFDFLGLEFDH